MLLCKAYADVFHLLPACLTGECVGQQDSQKIFVNVVQALSRYN